MCIFFLSFKRDSLFAFAFFQKFISLLKCLICLQKAKNHLFSSENRW